MVMSAVTSRPRAGRPKDAAKRAGILAAAWALFRCQPYEMVTMEAVAARAGVSKMTVYSHFLDKETMFEEVVRGMADEMIGALDGKVPVASTLRERLELSGISYLTVILDAPVRMMGRTLSASLQGDQALARRFYEAGPGRTRAALAAIIDEAAARGELRLDSADWAADDLVSLWVGGVPDQLAFGVVEQTSPAEIVRRARRGTDIFLRAYGVSQTA